MTVSEQRREFDHRLDAIDIKIIEMFAIICEDLPAATQALVSGNNQAASQLAERDKAIDALHREIEQLASREIVLQAPVASDLRFLLTVLRIAPELERSHDLECEIAEAACQLLGADMGSPARGLTERMSELAREMWDQAAGSWYSRDGKAASALAQVYDEMSDLRASMAAELASGRIASAVTMQVAVVARLYERLGAHAVNIARRVSYLAGTHR